jgi:MerR family copper efflux transcriptional regulator
MEPGLRIGVVARRSGLSPDTLRHYGRLGLLPELPRRSGGQRRYPAEALRRIQVVQAALAVGFTLKELAWAFGERRAGRPPCRRVQALAREKLADLDARLVELARVRESLSQALVVWERRLASGEPAGLLQALGDLELSGRAVHTPRRRAR